LNSKLKRNLPDEDEGGRAILQTDSYVYELFHLFYYERITNFVFVGNYHVIFDMIATILSYIVDSFLPCLLTSLFLSIFSKKYCRRNFLILIFSCVLLSLSSMLFAYGITHNGERDLNNEQIMKAYMNFMFSGFVSSFSSLVFSALGKNSDGWSDVRF
jgi:uncharacterized membrane protein